MDDPGAGYRAADLVAAVHALADSWMDGDGLLHPLVLCYRDARQRTAYVVMLQDDEKDQRVANGEDLSIELVEVAFPGGTT
jgi:hypothetical protein